MLADSMILQIYIEDRQSMQRTELFPCPTFLAVSEPIRDQGWLVGLFLQGARSDLVLHSVPI